MSTSGDGNGGRGGDPPQQLYFCHHCNRTVTITPPPTGPDLSCPICSGGFLEEMDSPSPTATLEMGPTLSLTDLASLLSDSTPSPTPNRSSPPILHDPDGFNPFLFLQDFLQTHGANIQFVFDNNNDTDPNAFRLPADLGDYFIGPGLEQLIEQLAEDDPNRYGTPPASKSAVEGLPAVKITEDVMDSDSSQCAVCKDTFELGEETKLMPCKHIYHNDCIIPWLELHNSCPVCRYELPTTDDPDYEQREENGDGPSVSNGDSNVNAGGNDESRESATAAGGRTRSGEESSLGEVENPLPQTPRMVERRFTISLPWPFGGGPGPSGAEASDSSMNNGSRSNREVNDSSSNFDN